MEKEHSVSMPEARFLSLEQEILRSLTLLMKNVSDFFADVPYFNLAPMNTTSDKYYSTLESHLIGTGLENRLHNLVSIFFTYVILTTLIWIFNRTITKFRIISIIVEIILSWVVVLLISPIILLIVIPVLTVRLGVTLYLRLRYGSTFFVCNPFDAVWSFERPASTSTCIGLYIIEGEANLEKIRKLLYERVMLRYVNGELVYDRFRWALRNICGFVCWKRLEHFELNYHLKLFPGQNNKKWTETDLFEALANRQDVTLCSDENRAPWEILVVPNFIYSNGAPGRTYYAITFRMHHSMMDGISMGNILQDCIADHHFKFSVDPIEPLKVSKFTIWIAYVVSFIMLPRITFKNLCFFEKNAFHEKTLTGPKEICWSRPIKLDALKKIKNSAKCSVFSVLLSSLGGSLRKLYESKGYTVPSMIHASPPIAILPYPDRRPRNRFSVVLYPLAIGKDCILERLAQIFQASKKLASSPEVISNFYIVYILGLLPYRFLEILAPLAHATMTFSNIPGPSERVTVFQGDPIVELGAWIPIKNRIGIGMALFSYLDRVRVTFIGDRASLPDTGDVQKLCNKFEEEVSLLGNRLGFDEFFIS